LLNHEPCRYKVLIDGKLKGTGLLAAAYSRRHCSHLLRKLCLYSQTLPILAPCRYKVLIDGKLKGTGLLAAADFSPPLQPPAELPDPEDVKPEDWVEEDE
jgi:hypothetical protein